MKNSDNGSRMMLTELMFSIFFFMVIVAICLQLFAGAITDARASRELTMAVNLVSGEADRFIANGRTKTPALYDSEGELTDDRENAGYELVSDKLHTKGRLQSTTLSFINLTDGSTVYSLDISRRL